MKRIYLLVILLMILLATWPFRRDIRRRFAEHIQTRQSNSTVQDRLNQYSRPSRHRWKPSFDQAGITWPGDRIALIGIKDEKLLEVWAANGDQPFRFIRSFPIMGASGGLGPKLKEGDCRVPEGIYRIESLNPNSKFHLALRINYPNDYDRQYATRENRTNLGGDIMIHGGHASVGCLAMGDQAAEDLFILAAEAGIENITVLLCPVDFRKKDMPNVNYPMPEWTNDLYRQLKDRLSAFICN